METFYLLRVITLRIIKMQSNVQSTKSSSFNLDEFYYLVKSRGVECALIDVTVLRQTLSIDIKPLSTN